MRTVVVHQSGIRRYEQDSAGPQIRAQNSTSSPGQEPRRFSSNDMPEIASLRKAMRPPPSWSLELVLHPKRVGVPINRLAVIPKRVQHKE